MSEEKKPTKMQLGQYIKAKMFDIPYVNSKGYMVGNYKVKIDRDNLPFTSYDEVDHYLINTFNYVRKVPYTKKDLKEFNKEFFKHNENVVSWFKPIKYRKQTVEEAEEAEEAKKAKKTEKAKGGSRKTNHRQSKRTKSRRKPYTRKINRRKMM